MFQSIILLILNSITLLVRILPQERKNARITGQNGEKRGGDVRQKENESISLLVRNKAR